MRKINLIIVGATGLVGSNFLSCLQKSYLPIGKLRLVASAKSKGKGLYFRGKEYIVEELNDASFVGFDFAFFSAGRDVCRDYIAKAIENNCIIVDNSSYLRMDKNVPLIIPEVNFQSYSNQRIIANPNCSTIQSVLAIHNIIKNYTVTRVSYSTYQSVSGSGVKGVTDLFLTKQKEKEQFYPYPISETCIPLVDELEEDGFSKEEWKMINETQKILQVEFPINATCVRVPILYGHGISIIVDIKETFCIDDITNLIADTPGVLVVKNPKLPTTDKIVDSDNVYVGRIRKDCQTNSVCMYVVANNLRRGAATNALNTIIKIFEYQENKN